MRVNCISIARINQCNFVWACRVHAYLSSFGLGIQQLLWITAGLSLMNWCYKICIKSLDICCLFVFFFSFKLILAIRLFEHFAISHPFSSFNSFRFYFNFYQIYSFDQANDLYFHYFPWRYNSSSSFLRYT